MANIPLRERIEREAKRRLEALSNPPTVVERWDARGNSTQHEAAAVYPSIEFVEPDAIGSDPSIQRTFELIIAITLAQAEDDSTTTASLINTWIARCEEALTDESDPKWREDGTNENLILECRFNGADEPQPTEQFGDMELRVRFELTYETLRGDPYQGGGATTQTE